MLYGQPQFFSKNWSGIEVDADGPKCLETCDSGKLYAKILSNRPCLSISGFCKNL